MIQCLAGAPFWAPQHQVYLCTLFRYTILGATTERALPTAVGVGEIVLGAPGRKVPMITGVPCAVPPAPAVVHMMTGAGVVVVVVLQCPRLRTHKRTIAYRLGWP